MDECFCCQCEGHRGVDLTQYQVGPWEDLLCFVEVKCSYNKGALGILLLIEGGGGGEKMFSWRESEGIS